jgi:TonB family protein
MRALATKGGLAHRFEIALAASLALNAAAWCLVAASVQYKVAAPPRPLEFQRVIIDKKGRTFPKVVRHIVPTRPKFEPPHPKQFRRQPPLRQKPPDTAHNRIVTAAHPKDPPPKSDAFTVPDGGNSRLGASTDFQGTGNADTNPPPQPQRPEKQPPAPQRVDQPRPQQPQQPVPQPVEPTRTQSQPTPPPPPKPKGETREAVPTDQVTVEIPDDLKSQSFKSFVRVRVMIAADGSFTVTLRTSSGNKEVDKLVLDALNKWKWNPALKNGDAIDSVQAFRFNFDVG